jgi:hypothetical protein
MPSFVGGTVSGCDQHLRATQGAATMTKYVLYIEHDSGPHDVSVHDTQLDAEDALSAFGEDRLSEHLDPPPFNEELVSALAEFGEYARIYKCDDNGSVEIKPFCTTFDQSEAA